MFQRKLVKHWFPLALLSALAVGTPPLAAQPAARTVQQPCSIEPYERVDVYPAVPGVLMELKVDIGARVKRGDLLAVLDARLFQLRLDKAKAGVQQAQAQVVQADAALDAAKAAIAAAECMVDERKTRLDSAEATLRYRQQVHDRLKQLYATRSVEERLVSEARDRLEAAKGQSAVAAAALARAKAEVAVKQSGLQEVRAARAGVQAKVTAATTALAKARYMLDLTRLTAPFDGVITHCNGAVGQLLATGEAGARRPLLTVERMDMVRVVVQIPQRDALAVKVGDAVSLTFDALPAVTVQAKVSRIAFVLDPGSRTMRAEIDVPNPNERLRPGMYGTATLQLK